MFMPRTTSRSSPWKSYTWEWNVNLIHYAGSWAAVIRPDMPDEELYPLLDGLNGVVMPGGGLEMFGKSQVDEPIPYYKTSKKIFEYA